LQVLYEDREENEKSEASKNMKFTTAKAIGQQTKEQTEKRILNSSSDDFLTKRTETSKSTMVFYIVTFVIVAFISKHLYLTYLKCIYFCTNNLKNFFSF